MKIIKIFAKHKGGDILKKVQISLNSVEKVRDFVNLATKLDCDLDLVSGRYMIDGKSIMGIFSLNLLKPIEMSINTRNNMDYILKELETFII